MAKLNIDFPVFGRDDLKSLIQREGYSLKDFNEILNKINGTSYGSAYFSSRLGNLNYIKFQEVLDLLGYEMIIQKKSQ